MKDKSVEIKIKGNKSTIQMELNQCKAHIPFTATDGNSSEMTKLAYLSIKDKRMKHIYLRNMKKLRKDRD